MAQKYILQNGELVLAKRGLFHNASNLVMGGTVQTGTSNQTALNPQGQIADPRLILGGSWNEGVMVDKDDLSQTSLIKPPAKSVLANPKFLLVGGLTVAAAIGLAILIKRNA